MNTFNSAYIEGRRFNELNILGAIRRQSAQGALYQLIFNALMQPQRHLRTSILALCRRQGFSTDKAATALMVMERADWLHTATDGLEVIVFLTEHAKLAGGAEL